MKILIVYDSLYGNTEKVAQAVKKGFSNDHEVSIIKANLVSKENLQDLDLLIVGSPTHGGGPSEKTKAFFKDIPNESLKGKKAAAFDTAIKSEGKGKLIKFIIKFFGYASGRIAKLFESKGAEVIGKKTFFVLDKEGPLEEKELERAEKWAKRILKGL